MEINKRKSIHDNLSKYDYLVKEDSEFIEVTEWTNEEGIDICINEKQFSLSYGQLDAINYLTKTLQYEKE